MVRACHRDLDSEDLSPWGMHVGKKPPKAPTTTTGRGGEGARECWNGRALKEVCLAVMANGGFVTV